MRSSLTCANLAPLHVGPRDVGQWKRGTIGHVAKIARSACRSCLSSPYPWELRFLGVGFFRAPRTRPGGARQCTTLKKGVDLRGGQGVIWYCQMDHDMMMMIKHLSQLHPLAPGCVVVQNTSKPGAFRAPAALHPRGGRRFIENSDRPVRQLRFSSVVENFPEIC